MNLCVTKKVPTRNISLEGDLASLLQNYYRNRGRLKVLKDPKLILWGHLDSLELCKTLRGCLFHKPVTGPKIFWTHIIMKLLQRYLNLRRYFTLTPMFKTKWWHFTPLSTFPLGGDLSEKLSEITDKLHCCYLWASIVNKMRNVFSLRL